MVYKNSKGDRIEKFKGRDGAIKVMFFNENSNTMKFEDHSFGTDEKAADKFVEQLARALNAERVEE